MHNVIILGAGKIGSAIAKLLHHSGDYLVWVADNNETQLNRLQKSVPVKTITLEINNEEELVNALTGKERVISACPYYINPVIAHAALKAGISYFDLTEDRDTAAAVLKASKTAKDNQVFMPQCGLAPGFISILAQDLSNDFEQIDEIKMRVGALPQYPSNMLMYNLTWSTDGLINEYCNPCEAIYDGRLTETMPLTEIEHFSLDGINYEAFNTSGGLGTLCDTLNGKVKHLNYKTVRYKGHRYLMSFLVKDLGLGKRRKVLKDILEKAVPVTYQDVVLVFCTVSGSINGQLTQRSDARKIYHQELFGEQWSSIQITTAASACAVVDLQAGGNLPENNFIKQEDVPLDIFLNNRFGQYYNP